MQSVESNKILSRNTADGSYTDSRGAQALPPDTTENKEKHEMLPEEILALSENGEMPEGIADEPGTDTEPSFPENASLAMAYVPYQRFEGLYDEETALDRGTLFKALDLPFYGGKDVRNGR